MHVSSPWVTAGLPVPYGFSSRLHNESLPFWGPFVPMRNSVSVKDEAGLISNTRADAWDTLLSHLCWCHSCWTVICNSVGWARRLFFFSQRFSTHEGFTSDSFNFIRHGLAPECECISFLQRLPVQFREGKPAGGVDDSRRWKAVSAHAAPLSWNKILYTCFFDTDRPW